MITDLFIIIHQDKPNAFAGTESGRIFDVTDCEPITDSKYGINLNGVLPNAKQVTPEYVADLLTKGATLVFKKRKKRTKRRAALKSTRRSTMILEAP